MINACPFCGFNLKQPLFDGVTQCSHCSKFFESTNINKLLSAAWELRRKNLTQESLLFQTKLDKDLVEFVYYFVWNLSYSHDEFLKLLQKIC